MNRIVLGLVLASLVTSLAFAAGEEESGTVVPYEPDKSYEISIGVYGELERAYRAVFATPAFKRAFPFVTISYQTSDFDGHHNRLTVLRFAFPVR